MDEIRKLIKLLEESDLQEIEVARWWGLGRVRLTKSSPNHAGSGSANGGHVAPTVVYAAPPQAAAPAVPGEAPGAVAVAQAPAVPAIESRYVAIKSPMVGTFYRAPAPDADPYVEVGQMVDVGQTVCIVEAMKLMNEIEADARGRIVAIKVDNKQPVEYGQVLFLIDPQG